MLKLSLIIASILMATAASSHPGHGESSGLVHYLTEPLHTIGGVALVLAAVGGARAVYRRHAREAS